MINNTRNLVIVQDVFATYRVPLYRRLSEEYSVTIVHTGIAQNVSGVREVVLRKFNWLGFFFVKGLFSALADLPPSTSVIFMFDIRWITYMTWVIKYPRRAILWGHRSSSYRLVNMLRISLIKRSKGLLQYDFDELEALWRRGVKLNKIFVAKNTVFDAYKKLDLTRRDFVYIGNLNKRKKILELVEICEKYWSIHTNESKLIIIGEGEEMPLLRERLVRGKLSDKVVLLGKIQDSATIANVTASCCAYISAGALGLGVLHAIALGLPVISLKDNYHGSEISNVLTGFTGFNCNTTEEFIRNMYLTSINPKKFETMCDFHRKYISSEFRMLSGFIEALDYEE